MPRGSGTRQDPEQMCWGSRCWSSDTWQRFVLARATYVLQAVPDLRYSWCLTRGKSVLSAGRRYRNTSATQVSLCAGEPQQRCPLMCLSELGENRSKQVSVGSAKPMESIKAGKAQAPQGRPVSTTTNRRGDAMATLANVDDATTKCHYP